jgi:CMP-N-acetylneuraminic acid synthetase
MRTLALIPARGGSRGVPRKNVRPLLGRPLIAYTIDAARAARTLARVVVSTEDAEIAAVAAACGAEVPFHRPAALAADETPMLPVVQHALRALAARDDIYDAVCLLQPSAPLRTAREIDACVALLAASDADAVVSVRAVPNEHNPHWVYFRAPNGALRLAMGDAEPIARRQALPPAFHRDGAVYVTRAAVVLEGGSLYGARCLGHECRSAGRVNIDTMDDWRRAERLLRRRVAARAAAPAGGGA